MQSPSKEVVVFFSWLTKINSPGIPAPGCPRFLDAGQTSGFAPTAGMVWLLPAGQDASSHLQRGPRKAVFDHTIPRGQKVRKGVKAARRCGVIGVKR